MTAQEFQALLIEGGLDEATAVRLATNEKVSARTSQLKQATEYQSIEARANALAAEKAALEAELVGTNAKPGSRAYQKWYADNFQALEDQKKKLADLEKNVAVYEATYGKITATGEAPKPPAGVSPEEIKKLVSEEIQKGYTNNYAPAVVSTMTGVAKVIERHMKRGRKADIDWTKLDEIAADPKVKGDPLAAYEIWDAPNVEADRVAAEAQKETDIQKRIDAKVQEELKRRNVSTNFPAGADATAGGGALSPLSRDRADSKGTYDRSKLLESWNSVQ